MIAVHKISEEFYEDTFTLIALHSSLEDYAMVYALNQCLKSKFRRTPEDLELSDHLYFPIFEWKDISNDRYWTLITNNAIREEQMTRVDLFENEPSFTKLQVIPEYKEADYLLKIEHDGNLEENLMTSLLSIPKVITAYTIEVDGLKSKTNLIF